MSLPIPIAPPAQTCCIAGYVYNPKSGKCDSIISNSIPPTTPVPCACCPPGFTFIDGAGQFVADDLSVKTIVNPSPSAFYNTCATIVNVAYAIAGPAPVPPIACPCCPVGYTYVSDISVCVFNTNPKLYIDPIPCLPCLCVAPPVIPPCVGCQPASHVATSFTFDPTVKQCVDCDKKGEPTGLGGCIDTFIPLKLTDPLINFRLNS